ncbi:SRPBCC family protein [Chitiniphilus shinanonensis]|uniref:SRPBCC family protein n=1 Tax=Chitiniphilus shinanonensis TaxID=553088 RepID=UPI003044C881
MHFEHLLQINDDSNPMTVVLSAEQLWRGLVHRAQAPQDFMEQVDHVALLHREDNYLEREMRMGNLSVIDHITFTPGQQVHYDTQPGDTHGGGSLTMTIEQPGPGALFLRVVYETPLPDTPSGNDTDDSYYVDYVKEAYRQSDIDTVRRIRELAQGGFLD